MTEQKGYSFKKLICTHEDERLWYAKKSDETYEIYNQAKNELLGFVEKRRVGKFMHWQLIFNKNLFNDCDEVGFTNGCLKEISKFITSLYKKQERKEKGCGKTFYFDGDHRDYEMCGDNNYLCHKCKNLELDVPKEDEAK